MYKLAVLDMDGTMLDPRGRVTAYTKKTIQRLQEKGVYVSICTGRNLRNTMPFAKKVGLQIPFLCVDGTAMYDTQGNCIYSNDLCQEEITRILSILEKKEVYLEVVTKKYYYKQIRDEALRKYDFDPRNGIFDKIRKRLGGRLYIRNQEQLQGVLNQDIHQIIAGGEKGVLEEIKQEIQSLSNDRLEIRDQLWGDYLFIHRRGICKSAGVAALCRHLEISMEEVIAIGDERNDIDMLKAVGLGIAMGNGREDVKEIARDITLSNQDNGAAYALEHYFLKNKKSSLSTTHSANQTM